MDAELEAIASKVIDVAMRIHVDVGPGLLESVYETLLANRLRAAGLNVDRQMPVKAVIDGIEYPDAFRIDILVANRLIVEVKSVEKLAPVHAK